MLSMTLCTFWLIASGAIWSTSPMERHRPNNGMGSMMSAIVSSAMASMYGTQLSNLVPWSAAARTKPSSSARLSAALTIQLRASILSISESNFFARPTEEPCHQRSDGAENGGPRGSTAVLHVVPPLASVLIASTEA
jgi:hypothetical protein